MRRPWQSWTRWSEALSGCRPAGFDAASTVASTVACGAAFHAARGGVIGSTPFTVRLIAPLTGCLNGHGGLGVYRRLALHARGPARRIQHVEESLVDGLRADIIGAGRDLLAQIICGCLNVRAL